MFLKNCCRQPIPAPTASLMIYIALKAPIEAMKEIWLRMNIMSSLILFYIEYATWMLRKPAVARLFCSISILVLINKIKMETKSDQVFRSWSTQLKIGLSCYCAKDRWKSWSAEKTFPVSLNFLNHLIADVKLDRHPFFWLGSEKVLKVKMKYLMCLQLSGKKFVNGWVFKDHGSVILGVWRKHFFREKE